MSKLNIIKGKAPRELGFHFPAEFEQQESIWLSWPHNVKSWPDGKEGKKELNKMLPDYVEFVLEIARHQKVNIQVNNKAMQQNAWNRLVVAGVVKQYLENINFYFHPTNDAWCRDHGPAFVVNRTTGKKAIVDWEYNAWGGKYPHDLDNQIPSLIAQTLNLPVFKPGIIMEGGSVDFNGQGTVITTNACLLNPNRNPHLSVGEIEKYLRGYYGVSNVIWLNDGIVGDDTDGHVDDITRFVNSTTVVTAVEHRKSDANYKPLAENLEILAKAELEDGGAITIIELPMPKPVYYANKYMKRKQRLPASYANFLITNEVVVVPTFQDLKNDEKALSILQAAFPERKVIGVDSVNIIWGLGSFHCLSQQEPAI